MGSRSSWGYTVGRFLSISLVGVIIYSLYGLLYWVVTGRMYFGPWEWGLCLVTALYIRLIHKAERRKKMADAALGLGMKRKV